jgi:NAD-dependent SIR2 family protein deacetylase
MSAEGLPMSKCPTCGYEFDAASQPTDLDSTEKPREGDLSLCMKCGEIGVFGKDMIVRPATVTDMMGLDAENSRVLTTMQSFIRKMRPIP